MNTLIRKTEPKNQMTEKEYHEVQLDSYSSLKVYAEAPMKFFKQYITRETKKDDASKDMIMGSVIHSLLARDDGYIDEDRFLIGDVSEIDKDANHPSYFAWKIWELTEMDVNLHGSQTRSFQGIAEEAFQLTKYNHKGEEVRFKKKDIEYAMTKFEGTPLEMWYNQKRLAYGRMLVSMNDVENCEKIYNELKSYPDTMWIYTQKTDDRYEIHKELPVMFHHDGIDLKMMADEVIIDHKEKIIAPYDTKVTWQEDFQKPYLENWYYLQGATYDTGLATWQKVHGYEKYKRLPMQFVRVHNLSWYKPLICPMSANDLKAAMSGFKTKWGREYPGFRKIVQDLQWSLDTGIWSIRREDYMNKSVRPLKIPYGQ